MKGNFHVRFLGGCGRATARAYPAVPVGLRRYERAVRDAVPPVPPKTENPSKGAVAERADERQRIYLCSLRFLLFNPLMPRLAQSRSKQEITKTTGSNHED